MKQKNTYSCHCTSCTMYVCVCTSIDKNEDKLEYTQARVLIWSERDVEREIENCLNLSDKLCAQMTFF